MGIVGMTQVDTTVVVIRRDVASEVVVTGIQEPDAVTVT